MNASKASNRNGSRETLSHRHSHAQSMAEGRVRGPSPRPSRVAHLNSIDVVSVPLSAAANISICTDNCGSCKAGQDKSRQGPHLLLDLSIWQRTTHKA